ncbi:hypothetical protein E2C01_034937 [Portunus trituberculatus]|uniref:Ig-like domain-containing protein n=1 Tax=Portunus trituberculatus TaxID=210409 RepID=A0A5B7F7Z1_PORTR|nr:hypothetical protein [Portunus trituberculatus]
MIQGQQRIGCGQSEAGAAKADGLTNYVASRTALRYLSCFLHRPYHKTPTFTPALRGYLPRTEKSPSRTVSRLKLSAVTPTDSGRYSCRPDTGGFASIILHIQADQPRAAVQQSGHNASLSPSSSLRLALLLRVLAYLLVHTHR